MTWLTFVRWEGNKALHLFKAPWGFEVMTIEEAKRISSWK
jgi:hypothetical protein